MKKIILVLFGILFVIFTGLSLLVCMISGIPTMDQPAATFPGKDSGAPEIQLQGLPGRIFPGVQGFTCLSVLCLC